MGPAAWPILSHPEIDELFDCIRRGLDRLWDSQEIEAWRHRLTAQPRPPRRWRFRYRKFCQRTKAARPIPFAAFIRIESGCLVPCEPNAAQVITYTSPTINDEAELQDQYKIDYHTLQSSLDPDELSRLEIEPDHAAIIFKRPKSFCAGDNFLMKLTSTGVFVYENYLVIVMADDSPIFEGRVPFPVNSIHDVIMRLLYQATMHFEGHLKAINMLADSLERRINTSLENKYLLNMFALEKSLVYILNSIDSNGALLERMKSLPRGLVSIAIKPELSRISLSKISSVTAEPRSTPKFSATLWGHERPSSATI